MRTIFKYQIETSTDTIPINQGAKFLSVGVQNNFPYVWAEVDTDNKMIRQEIHVYGTGHEISPCDWLEFIGRLTLSDGTEWHVFKGKEIL